MVGNRQWEAWQFFPLLVQSSRYHLIILNLHRWLLKLPNLVIPSLTEHPSWPTWLCSRPAGELPKQVGFRVRSLDGEGLLSNRTGNYCFLPVEVGSDSAVCLSCAAPLQPCLILHAETKEASEAEEEAAMACTQTELQEAFLGEIMMSLFCS